MSNLKEVLVVTVGAPLNEPVTVTKAFAVEELQKLRDYIIESVQKEVLVLDARMELQVKQLPDVKAEDVLIQQTEDPNVKKTTAPVRSCAVPKKLTPREEKQLILERLKEFREKHGLGSLNLVAEKVSRKGITGEILRMLLSGDAKLEIQEWRAIGKALDELEAEGGADG